MTAETTAAFVWTPARLRELNALAKGRQTTFGAARTRVQNTLVAASFARYVEDVGTWCEITTAGREALAAAKNRVDITPAQRALLLHADLSHGARLNRLGKPAAAQALVRLGLGEVKGSFFYPNDAGRALADRLREGAAS